MPKDYLTPAERRLKNAITVAVTGLAAEAVGLYLVFGSEGTPEKVGIGLAAFGLLAIAGSGWTIVEDNFLLDGQDSTREKRLAKADRARKQHNEFLKRTKQKQVSRKRK